MKRWLWVVLVVLVVASILPKPVGASGSVEVEISDNLKDYVTVEMKNVPEDLEKIWVEDELYNSYYNSNSYMYLKVYVKNHDKAKPPTKIQLPNGVKVKPETSWWLGVFIDVLYPGEWVLYYDYGFVVHFRVPKIKVNFDYEPQEGILDEWFEICAHGTSPLFPDEKFKLKLSLIDLSGRPIKENSECLIYKPKEPGVYKVNAIDDGDKYSKYLEPVVLDTYTIKVYVNPVIEESPSEIESILKDAKDTFTIHIKNVEDDSKGDYFLKNPSKAFEVKLYDPNGVLYDKTEARYTASLKVPDKDRPGYWRIVVSYPGHPEFSNEVEFYVEPKKKDRIVNISATGICGPGALIPLSLLALGLVRKRK